MFKTPHIQGGLPTERCVFDTVGMWTALFNVR